MNAVSAELAVANVDAAESEAEVRFVTADAVTLDTAFAPYMVMIQLVFAAAQDSKCPTAYSPAESDVDAKVNGCTFGLLHPCWRLLNVPPVVLPDAHATVRDAVATVASEVALPKENMSSVCDSEPAPELDAGKLMLKARSASVTRIG